jgi:parallel beta-helix repeat protein
MLLGFDVKRFALTFILSITLCSVLVSFPRINHVKASPDIIYIRANGAIDPPTANITTSDNVIYTLNDNIFNCSIVVERNNIIIEGANKTLQGTGSGTGIDLTGRSNVTVKNIEIKEFSFGIYLYSSSNITITENRIINNTSGVYLRYTLNSNLTENMMIDNNGGILLFQADNNTRIIRNNMTNNSEYAIQLMYSSSYNLILENHITGDMWYSIKLSSAGNCNIIAGNSIANNSLGSGISISSSSYNYVNENNITNTYNGIELWHASNNTICGNNVLNSSYKGFTLYYSSNNNITKNSITNSTYNLDVFGDELSHFMNFVDVSNLINGKPIYYYANETNLVINSVTHHQIGYLACINCDNVMVENLTFTNNAQGVLIAYTNNSKMKDNNMMGNEYGVILKSSFNSSLCENNITDNPNYGIELDDSFDNTIFENNIKNNGYGIFLYDSSNNTFFGNWIADNEYGISPCPDYPNRFYHNNLINNTQQVYFEDSGYTNFWDNDFEGNYWSNYTGVDLNHDGIGDIPHVLDADNQDNYPLMGLFNSFSTSLGYHVNVISNSTIQSFEYFESNTTIKMYVSNMTTNQEFGFCRIAIPRTLMNVSAISVIIDDGLIPVLYPNYTLYDNGTHKWIYFAYEHSIREIDIIPEFPSLIILPSLIVATLLIVIVYKTKCHT